MDRHDAAAMPWEIPLAGDEVDHLVGSLDRLRATFRWKAEGLDAAGLSARLGVSAMTLGGLLKHLALVEDDVFACRLSDDPLGPTWDAYFARMTAPPADDWSFTSAADEPPAVLYALYDGAVARSRVRLAAALAAGGLDQEVAMADDAGRHASLRRLLCDLLEEYGRHTGHADLLREAVDGRVGEDPPAYWVGA